MPAKTESMQDRVPGTDHEVYADSLAEATAGDGFSYCLVQKNSETFPGHRSQISHVLGQNSLTVPGKKMWEPVTDERLLHFVEDQEMVLVRRRISDTDAVTARDAKPRVQGANTAPLEEGQIKRGTQHDFRQPQGAPISLKALESHIPTQADRQAEAAAVEIT